MATERALLYDRLVEQTGELGASHRWLVQRTPPGSVVLDAGCAGGYLARVLTETRDCVVDGIEVEPESAARAASACRRVFLGSLDDEDFLASLAGSYDRILFGDVLEHLREPERTLRAITGLLTPGGRILASLPNVAYWHLRWQLLRGRFEYEDSGLMDRTHLRFYTFETAADLFLEAGLRICARSFTTRLPTRVAGRAVRRWSRRLPNLFAYQSLIEAAPRTAGAAPEPPVAGPFL
ncbi:MAG: class I SAM-dependent methyltransferase [Gemmatimonadetes bacterium]|nr:class I SAM-dependent methyltransferase [Gemmatimonadota bacterium]MBA4156815.1 class I SAM-dependent methyltransferase [Gemmatimonadota bacterium]